MTRARDDHAMLIVEPRSGWQIESASHSFNSVRPVQILADFSRHASSELTVRVHVIPFLGLRKLIHHPPAPNFVKAPW